MLSRETAHLLKEEFQLKGGHAKDRADPIPAMVTTPTVTRVQGQRGGSAGAMDPRPPPPLAGQEVVLTTAGGDCDDVDWDRVVEEKLEISVLELEYTSLLAQIRWAPGSGG